MKNHFVVFFFLFHVSRCFVPCCSIRSLLFFSIFRAALSLCWTRGQSQLGTAAKIYPIFESQFDTCRAAKSPKLIGILQVNLHFTLASKVFVHCCVAFTALKHNEVETRPWFAVYFRNCAQLASTKVNGCNGKFVKAKNPVKDRWGKSAEMHKVMHGVCPRALFLESMKT